MVTTDEASRQPVTERDWRYRVGLALFVLSLILPLLALVLVPLLGVSPGISTVLYGLSIAGGPDLLLVAAAAMLGKENMEHLISRLGGRFRRLVRWDHVSPRRYRVGVLLLVIAVAIPLLLFYVLPESMRNGDQPGWGFYMTVAGDILFVVSFFVLGAEFWAKTRALFLYDARVVVEE